MQNTFSNDHIGSFVLLKEVYVDVVILFFSKCFQFSDKKL